MGIAKYSDGNRLIVMFKDWEIVGAGEGINNEIVYRPYRDKNYDRTRKKVDYFSREETKFLNMVVTI